MRKKLLALIVAAAVVIGVITGISLHHQGTSVETAEAKTATVRKRKTAERKQRKMARH